AIAKEYAADGEIAAVANRTIELLAEMEQANALLAKGDFPELLAVCARLRPQYPDNPFFKRLEAEGIRAARQQALREIHERLKDEKDLQKKALLLGDALRQYPDEESLQREAQFVRGKLALIDSIVEKGRAAEEAGR